MTALDDWNCSGNLGGVQRISRINRSRIIKKNATEKVKKIRTGVFAHQVAWPDARIRLFCLSVFLFLGVRDNDYSSQCHCIFVYFWGRAIAWAMLRYKESMLQVWWFPWELPMTSTLAWSPMDGLSTNDLVPSLMLYGLFISHCRRPPIRAVEFTDVLVPGQQ